MREIILIFIVLIFSACVFTPDEPPIPSDRFVDRLNLNQIVSGTNANLSFSSYRELFELSDNFFVGIDGQNFSTERFISRLEEINRDMTALCSWNPVDQNGEPPVSMTAPTTLNARRFMFSSDNFGERTGDVRITVKWNGIRWQITKWSEGEFDSFFNPGGMGN